MKEENKKFLDVETFNKRVFEVMKYKGITIDNLFEIINNEIGYEITKNNLNIYLQRIPNAHFLIALSKALKISTDYLLGLTENGLYKSGFDYNFHEDKYKKYQGCYYFYYYPTVSHLPQKINKAELSIDENYKVQLIITTDEKDKKIYIGDFILSDKYDIGYISLVGHNIGEKVFLSFCDPVINGTVVKVELILGAMLSVSSGALRRVPVMSRFVLSRNEISKDKIDAIEANLMLNTKYINISPSSMRKSVSKVITDEDLQKKIINRLECAFEKKECYILEESYILNTLKNDMNLSFEQANKLLNMIRIESMYIANNKLNQSLDSRLYEYTKKK